MKKTYLKPAVMMDSVCELLTCINTVSSDLPGTGSGGENPDNPDPDSKERVSNEWERGLW